MPRIRRRLSADVRREQILETASRLFIERGFDNVKMADIAEQLQTSRPNIYTYYPSTEAILDTLLKQVIERWIERLKVLLPTGMTDNQTEVFLALLEERELLLLLNSGGGPIFNTYKRGVYKALEDHFRQALPPDLVEKQPEILRFPRIVAMGLATELLMMDEPYNAQEMARMLNTFSGGGTIALIPNIVELMAAYKPETAPATGDKKEV